MKIGVNRKKYPEQRCIIDKVKDYEYVYLPKNKILKISDYIERKLLKKNIPKNQFIHNRILHGDIDGYHFFNDITIANKPYITTFETFLPRINELSDIHQVKGNKLQVDRYINIEKKLSLLANENCRKIISLSKCNYNMQMNLLKLYPNVEKKILKKMIQINPPQEILIKEYEEKNLDDKKLRFVFVGRDFVRKGGVEIVTAFNEIMEKYRYEMELVLITDLDKTYNYAFKSFQDKKDDLKHIKKIIDNNDWIKYYNNLENDKVIEIMKNSHVGLLTTWADTYGYSVLEFQATGCPVITTNTRALCEINNNECGWIINVDTNYFGEIVIDDLKQKNIIRYNIINELKIIIKDIYMNKINIKIKGEESMNRIMKYHSPEKYEEIMKSIYTNAFNK